MKKVLLTLVLGLFAVSSFAMHHEGKGEGSENMRSNKAEAHAQHKKAKKAKREKQHKQGQGEKQEKGEKQD